MTATTARSRTASAKPFAAASPVSKLALKAVNGQIDRVSAILASTADSIDEILGGSNSPLPEAARGVVTATSGKLRDLADLATEEEAAKLIEGLQRSAGSHPAVTAGVGAALGAVLGLALARLGPRPMAATKAAKAVND